MQERLEKVEQALAELQRENSSLRAEMQALRAALAASNPTEAPTASLVENGRPRIRSRYSVLILVISLVLITVLAFIVDRVSQFWSGVLAALNGLLLYMVGPAAIRLLIEGLIRAIPTVVLGHTARVTWYKLRGRRGSPP